jgi:hypothetical protein
MATEETARTITTRTAGGSPYLDALINQSISQGIQVAQENRAQKGFEIALRRQQMEEERAARAEDRQAMRDEWEFKRLEMAEKRQDIADWKQLKDEELQTKAAEFANAVDDLDYERPDYQEQLSSLSNGYRDVLNSKYGRDVHNIIKAQNTKHNNTMQWLQAEAGKYGYQGSVMDLPRTKEGKFDLTPTGSVYGEQGAFTTAGRQKQAQLEASPEYQEKQAQQRTKGTIEARQDLGFLSSQRKQIMQEAGELNERQLMNPERFLDEKGRVTQDPAMAVTAVLFDNKNKPKIKIPESQRKDIMNRLELIKQAEQEIFNRKLQTVPQKKSLSTPSPMATKEEQPARKPLGEIF